MGHKFVPPLTFLRLEFELLPAGPVGRSGFAPLLGEFVCRTELELPVGFVGRTEFALLSVGSVGPGEFALLPVGSVG